MALMPAAKRWLALRRLLIWVWALATVLALVLAGFVGSDRPGDEDLFELFANSTLSSSRHAMIRMRTMEAIRELARQALAARRAGQAAELARLEVSDALERYWGPHDRERRCNHGRTRSLLTWRVPG